MNRIKFDRDRLNERMDCPYKYEFRSEWHLEYDAKEKHCLGNLHGFGIDVRDVVFEMLAKDFIMQLRKKIYGDDMERMIMTDLKDLI